MPRVVFKNLGSSSVGNSFILEIHRTNYDTPFILMLEAGFAIGDLKRRLFEKGYTLNDIDVALITHAHNDHSIAMKELSDIGVKVYAPKETFDKYEMVVDNHYVISKFVQKTIADEIKVFGIPLEHIGEDGLDVENYAYVITVENKYRILFATDTKYIKYNLSKYQFDMIVIESNYIHQQMYFALENAKEKNDHFRIHHYKRVMNSHLSVNRTAQTLSTFNLDKTKAIFLIHLTSGYNNPFAFKEIVEKRLKKENKRIPKLFVCDKKGNIL